MTERNSHVNQRLVARRHRLRVLAAGLCAAVAVSSGGAAASSSSESETHEITDALGTVEIPVRPQRIIADSVSTYAHLLALGVEPVGVAIPTCCPPSYFPVGEDVVNVVAEDGWTIDIEQALELDPDMILGGYADYNVENLERYRGAVPTYAWESGWEDTEHIYQQFRELAVNIGRADEAEEAIAAYEAKLAAGNDAVAPFVGELGAVGVVRLSGDGFVGVRTAERGHITSAILRALGIAEPDWPAAPDEDDYLILSEETLETLNIADTLFIEANGPVVTDPIAQSAVWQTLEPVKAGKVIYFETTWYNDDLLQLGSIVDEIVAGVTGAS